MSLLISSKILKSWGIERILIRLRGILLTESMDHYSNFGMVAFEKYDLVLIVSHFTVNM